MLSNLGPKYSARPQKIPSSASEDGTRVEKNRKSLASWTIPSGRGKFIVIRPKTNAPHKCDCRLDPPTILRPVPKFVIRSNPSALKSPISPMDRTRSPALLSFSTNLNLRARYPDKTYILSPTTRKTIRNPGAAPNGLTISYAVFCLKKKKSTTENQNSNDK